MNNDKFIDDRTIKKDSPQNSMAGEQRLFLNHDLWSLFASQIIGRCARGTGSTGFTGCKSRESCPSCNPV
jgi:hypothetical protein